MTTPRDSTLEELERLLILSAEETLAPYGVGGRASRSETISGGGELVIAKISFTAKHGSGSITIVAEYHVVEDLRPEGVTSTDAELICDVLGELANMMLGRLKAHLLRRGVCVDMGLPTKGLSTTTKMRSNPPGEVAPWQRCDLGRGPVYVRLQATIDDELRLADEADVVISGPGPESALFGQGDVFFFGGGME